MLIPSDELLLMTSQRHSGWDPTTVASCVQHAGDGIDVFPCIKSRHGDKLIRTLEQLD